MADFDRARDDLRAFADLAGHPVEEWQSEAMSVELREARETAVVGPRRSGKSRAAAIKALHHCYRAAESHVLVLAAGEERAKGLVAAARRMATRSAGLAPSVADEQSQLLVFSNGSTLRCVAATDAAVRGATASLVIADEASLISDDVLVGAARPIIASEPGGRFLMISSALRAGGAFFDAVVRGEAGSAHTVTRRWSLGDCHWISPTEVEAARESMSALRFAAEYEGTFASGQDAFLSRQALERVTVDYLPDRLDELAGPARVTAGCDWGWSHDRTAIVCVGRLALPGGRPVFAVRCAHAWPSGHPTPAAIDEIVSSPALYDVIVSESVGLGAPLTETLFAKLRARPAEAGGGRRPSRSIVMDEEDLDAFMTGRREWVPQARPAGPAGFVTTKIGVHTSAPIKGGMYGALRLLVEREQLLIPTGAEDLRRELALLRVDLSATGQERIEASSGHDDLSDALAFSLVPQRGRRDGRWRTMIGGLAERSLPDSGLPPGALEGLESVPAGAGLMVPRRPVWQTPRGTALTVPAGIDLTPRERPSEQVQAIRDSLRAAIENTTEGGP